MVGQRRANLFGGTYLRRWGWDRHEVGVELGTGGLKFRTVTTDTIHIQLMTDHKLIEQVADLLRLEKPKEQRSWRWTGAAICIVLLAVVLHKVLLNSYPRVLTSQSV